MKRNLQPPTSNLQCRTLTRPGLIGCSLLEVGGWMFPLIIFSTLPLHAQTNATAANTLSALLPPYGELPPTFWEQHGTSVVVAGFGIIAMATFGRWWFFRPQAEIIIPPEVQARQALEILRHQPAEGAVLSRVSQVVRDYFIAAFQLAPGEYTMTEFSRALSAHGQIGAENARSVSDFLHECDAKKFSTAPAAIPLNAAGRALELIACAEACRARSAPVPGAASSGGQDATAKRQTQSRLDVAASGDGRTP